MSLRHTANCIGIVFGTPASSSCVNTGRLRIFRPELEVNQHLKLYRRHTCTLARTHTHAVERQGKQGYIEEGSLIFYWLASGMCVTLVSLVDS